MTNYDKLIDTLREVFMLDKAELDFGIYRIMNQKRKDIEQFLEKDLIPQVKQVLAESLSVDTHALQKELEDAIKAAQTLGAEPDSLPKVQQLKARLGQAGDLIGMENEVFSLLTNFFKRYFDNGDFISMRRYKKDVYAIPYEGEEVKLHWANADQYYIKTSEYFKTYRFKLNNSKTVAFELIEANTEQNNNKAQTDKERRFAIYIDKPFEELDGEFKIYFTYEPADKKVKQSDLLEEAFDKVKTQIPQEYTELLSLKPTEKNKQRTLLEKHLLDYTARNTFDYFIHKDLGSFLTRELDFYIKNEVLFIDDLNTRDEQEFLKQLSKIKTIKKIGEKIIAFLAQIENFQKKLWLKKKFVVETNYCITLDRVPKELYSEILGNHEQLQEWIKLFAIDEIKPEKADGLFPTTKVEFSVPLTLEFLKQNQFLVLDTVFFSSKFKWKLIGTIENFDSQCDGLLISSENFQALNFITRRYSEELDCVFTDPPYNTKSGDFTYKDNFKNSSWLSLMYDRTSLSRGLLNEKGVFLHHIDENEHSNASTLLTQIFGSENRFGDIIWKNSSKNDEAYVSMQHEYIIGAVKNSSINKGDFTERKEGLEEIYSAFEKFKKQFKNDWKAIHQAALDWYNTFPDSNPIRSSKHYSWMDEKGVYFAADISGPNYGQYVFDVYHPTTGVKVKMPGSGWRFPEETMRQRVKDKLVHFNDNANVVPNNKTYLKDTENQSLTSIKYKDGRVASKVLASLFNDKVFSNPKDFELTGRLLRSLNLSDLSVIDYFAGSGTTGHATINLNRDDKGSRKYILVEMGNYFDTVTKPRIQKVTYSKEWKDGRPVNRDGISQCFKYIRLESYEDTLNNLAIKQNDTQLKVLDANSTFKEGYMLNYMLDVEAQDSLLNLDWFVNPFDCYLNITRNNEMQPTKVDLVETFNYLIGIVIENYAAPKEGYIVVTGKTLDGDKILVVWRDCNQHDNASLNTFLEKSKYNPLDSEYDRIYVNGDNNVENLKVGDERWKVILIEEEFKNRMFENY
ncbi:site-specific DNA-methyltransferase [Flavobacterium sp. UBA6046]|uniref:site-specific DNA-methyltransferase n=1 Tax=Flavobacterium sp. UBA6046 TaxID=1946552 RepID=UPI0025BD7911|nr:DNA methyltransferase [Flavobacterium sp. UBA6046]